MKALTPVPLLTSAELAELAKAEEHPRVRSRLLMLRYLLEGHAAPEAANVFALAATQVRYWIHRYNAGGPEALRDLPRAGRPPLLAPGMKEAFSARVRAGAQLEDGVCALHALDFQRILKEEFDSDYSLSGVYFLLHRLGFSSLVPRPRHPLADPVAQQAFKKTSDARRGYPAAFSA